MDIQKARSMIQQVACQPPAYEAVSIFYEKFSPYITIGEVVIEIDNGIDEVCKKEQEQAQSKEIVGRLAHIEKWLLWTGHRIIMLSVSKTL